MNLTKVASKAATDATAVGLSLNEAEVERDRDHRKSDGGRGAGSQQPALHRLRQLFRPRPGPGRQNLEGNRTQENRVDRQPVEFALSR